MGRPADLIPFFLLLLDCFRNGLNFSGNDEELYERFLSLLSDFSLSLDDFFSVLRASIQLLSFQISSLSFPPFHLIRL
jgi:hypothetical protein